MDTQKKPPSLLVAIATHPMKAVEIVIVSILFFSGLWLLSPLSVDGGTAGQASGDYRIAVVLGIFQVVMGLLYYYALWKPIGKRYFVRNWINMAYFCLFLFYAIAQFLLTGFTNVRWITTLGIALIAGIAHLRYKWAGEHHDGT